MGKRSRSRKDLVEAARSAKRLAAGEPVPQAAGPDHATVAVSVALAAFALYFSTLAPGVTLVDSGELILAAWSSGSAHAPGFPAYVGLTHLATLLPIGSVAWRVNLASAGYAAAAIAVFVLALAELLRGLRRRPHTLALAAAGLTLAAARTVWAYATVAEVYTLNLALLLGACAFVLRFRRTGQARALWLAALCYGAGLGVHHATVLVAAPGLLVLALSAADRRWIEARRLAPAVAAGLMVTLTCYAYLAWCAASGPVMNWGDPSSLTRLLWHVSGRQYQVNFEFSGATMARELGAFAGLLVTQFGPGRLPLALLAAGFGSVTLLRRDPRAALALLAVVVADLLLGACYEIAEDKDAYYLPAFAAVALLAGVGLDWLAATRARFAVLLLPALALWANQRGADRRADTLAPDLVAAVTAAVPAGSVLLTHEWQFFAPYWYLREVEGLRRDVCVIDVNLMRRSWYFAGLERACPELARAARPEVERFLVHLRDWEADPGAYARDAARRTRITAAFQAAVSAYARFGQAHGGTFATPDVVLPTQSPDPALAQTLTSGGATLVPQGLTFALRPSPEFVAPPALQPVRGLFDGSLTLDPQGPALLKLRPWYLAMVTNRGAYLAQHQQTGAAREAFLQALGLDPGYAPARTALERLAQTAR